MLRHARVVREAARRVAAAVQKTAKSMTTGSVTQETDFTSRMVARIEDAVAEQNLPGLKWSAHVLRDRGPHADESQYGADLLGVLNIELPDYSVSKGFLAQAKLWRSGQTFSMREWDRLTEQCEAMLDVTPHAYVLAYSPSGVRILSAAAVAAAALVPQSLDGFYTRSVSRFFEEHFECFIGDRRLSAAHAKSLHGITATVSPRTTLLLQLGSPLLPEEAL